MGTWGRSRWIGVVLAVVSVSACSAGHHLSPVAAGAAPTQPTVGTLPQLFPLTGEPTNGSSRATRPALSVKVDNAAGSFPQAGLAEADVVTEELVEGNLTRLFVTFQSHDAPLVGPIRSARPVDAELLRALDGGIFAYSGAAAGEIAPVKDHSDATLLSFDTDPGPFQRRADRAVPHNVFSSTAALYAAGLQAGALWQPPPAFLDRHDPPSAGQPIHQVTVPMSPTVTSTWTWTAGVAGFTRQQNGEPTVSLGHGDVHPPNVVILSVVVGHTGIFDARHNEDPRVVVLGHGRCWALSGGTLRSGSWQRPTLTSPLELLDAAGSPLGVPPGQTWVELLPDPSEPAFS